MIPLVIRKCLRSLLLNYLSKLYYSSEQFPALPLSLRRGGRGAFFSPKKKGRRKIIFYIFPFGLYSFLCPLLSAPHYVHIHKDIVVSAPLPAWEGVGKRLLGDLLFTDQYRLDGCCTSQTFLVCFQHFHFQQLVN